jgi:hypothetical protein
MRAAQTLARAAVRVHTRSQHCFFTEPAAVALSGAAPNAARRAHSRCLSTISATRLVYDAHGQPLDVLRLEEHRVSAEPSRGQVLVVMLASPINPADINQVILCTSQALQRFQRIDHCIATHSHWTSPASADIMVGYCWLALMS